MELRTTHATSGSLVWRIEETGTVGPPVLFLHGFSGNGRFWIPIAGALGPRHCVMPDLPGHGGTSAPLPIQAWGLDRAAAEIMGVLERIGIGRCHVVGYSMGGRLALHLALHPGNRVESLALVGASPGIDAPADRAQRRTTDEELARLLETEGIEAFVKRWEALPLFATQKELPEATRSEMHAARIGHRPLALAAALRAFSVGAQQPLEEALPRLSMPVLLVAGARDSKYSRIAERIGERIVGARVVIVPESGHAVPLEKPAEFASLLHSFIGPLAAKEESHS